VQARIGLAFAALALVVFVLVGGLSGAWVRSRVEATAGTHLAELAARMSASLDSGMFERYREIRNFAELELQPAGALDAARWRVVVDRLQASFPHYAWIGVAQPDGRVVSATRGLLEGQNVASRPWFQRGRSAVIAGDVHEALMLAQRLPPRPDGEPLRLVDVAAPIRRGHELLGVVGAHLSWAWAEELRDHLLRPADGARGVQIIVVNHAGEVLMAPAGMRRTGLQPAELAALTQGHQVLRWADGERYLSAGHRGAGYLDYPGLGWMVIARQPLAVATAEGRWLQWQLWGFGVLGALCFGACGWWLAGRLTAPLRRVAQQARVAMVDPESTVPGELPATDEVGELAHSLGDLVERLRSREHELIELTGSLEHQVAARTRELLHANEDLRSFVRMVSHDLKAPIGSLAVLLQLTLQMLQPLAERPEHMLKAAIGECERLARLVDELLVLSQVEQRPLLDEAVDMGELVRQVLDELFLADPARRSAVQIEVGPLPQVRGDALLLRQVWHNLIANALKFSAGRLTPCIKVRMLQRAHELEFQVGDNGAGFDMAQVGRLFGVFQRLHSGREFPGTGIGLTIVKRAVQRHEGRVWAESAPGQGARFYFVLPAGRLVSPQAPAEREAAVPSA
jgi:signal transduction histidine kinase